MSQMPLLRRPELGFSLQRLIFLTCQVVVAALPVGMQGALEDVQQVSERCSVMMAMSVRAVPDGSHMWLLSACTAASVTKERRFEFHLILINLNSDGHSHTCLVATKSDSADLANAIARRE